MSIAEIILLWLIAVAPATVYFLIWLAYNRILSFKHEGIIGLMHSGNAFRLYLKAFGAPLQIAAAPQSKPSNLDALQTTNPSSPSSSAHPQSKPPNADPLQATADRLFDLYYNWRAYMLPIIINTTLTTVAGLIALIWSNANILGIPDSLEVQIRRLPPVVLTALAGAYIWGLYDILRRYRAVDLSPISLHFVWLRLLMSPILGYLISLGVADSLKVLAGFVVGAFPAKTLLDFLRVQAKKHFNLQADTHPSEGPTLHKIQGLTNDVIETLSDEGIQSTASLAYADPIRLLLRTSLEWNVLLDIIDQSILFNYIEDKLCLLRRLGIRGAIELAGIGEDLEDDEEKVRKHAKKVVELIASKLGEPEVAVNSLIQVLREDPQVEFIWDLLGEALPREFSEEETKAT